jgi:hypothetical protein
VRGLNMAISVEEFEKMAYDESGNEICRPIVISKQKVSMELTIVNIDDSDNITMFMKKLGYKRPFFGHENNHIYMEFEKG